MEFDLHRVTTTPYELPPEEAVANWMPRIDALRELASADESAMSLVRLIVAVSIAVTLVSASLSLMV